MLVAPALSVVILNGIAEISGLACRSSEPAMFPLDAYFLLSGCVP